MSNKITTRVETYNALVNLADEQYAALIDTLKTRFSQEAIVEPYISELSDYFDTLEDPKVKLSIVEDHEDIPPYDFVNAMQVAANMEGLPVYTHRTDIRGNGVYYAFIPGRTYMDNSEYWTRPMANPRVVDALGVVERD